MVVLLYKSGIPVQLTEQFTELRYDIEGFLVEFTFQETTITPPKTSLPPPIRYVFYHKSKFKTNDRKRKDLVDGFYNETQYLKYIENTGPNIPLVNDMIYTYKFNFGKFLAKSGDSISVSVTNFDAPYSLFFDKKKYDFIIEKTIDGKGVRSYAEGILDGFEVIDYKLRLPSNFTPSTLAVASQVNTAGYHFYAKNLGDYINNFTNNDDKRKFKKITILIIFRIRDIIRDIFPDIMNNSTSEAILEAKANSIDTDLSGLSNLEQMLFLLKKSWGYYYYPNSTSPHRSTLPTMFNAQSSYSDFEYYYIGLVSFYNQTYVKQKALSTSSDSQKYDYLLSILPVNALSALPFEIIKKKILSLLDSKRNKEYREQYLARLVLAIAPAQANDFLDFLLEEEDCVHTNFERLFNYLDDAEIERIPVANWFTEEKTNRMTFIYAVNELWKVSKYSLQNASGEINKQSYFFTNGISYYKKQNGLLKPAVLECGRLSSVSSGSAAMPLQTNTWVNYEADKTLKHELVTINKKINITNYYLSTSGDYLGSAPSLDTNDSIPFQYHLYQSISLIGHQADDRVILPNNQPIPAFLFYYSDDFQRLLKIDAQIALAVNIGIEAVLFFTFGGISQLRHLQHLKYFTKIFRALNNELVASEEVLVWSGLEAGAQTISISAASMYSLGQYNATILPTEQERKAREEANKVYLYIALVFAGGSILLKNKAVAAADEILDSFPTGTLPADVENLLIELRGQRASNILSIRQKIADLELEGTNSIITKFDNYAVEVKEALWTDFKNLSKQEWNRLNNADALSIDRWKYLFDRKIIDRKILNVIGSQIRVNAIVKCYNYGSLKDVLEPLEASLRWKFLNTFEINPQYSLSPTGFNKMVNSPIRAQLALAHLQDIKQGSNILVTSDIKYILESNADDLIIDFKIIDVENSLNAQTNKTFNNIANRELLSNDRLLNIHKGNFDDVNISLLSRNKQKIYEGGSKLVVEVKVYNNGVATGDLIAEKYIAGHQTPQRVFSLDAASLPHNYKDFDDYTEFKVFYKKAFDLENVDRFKDAEKKFIYNFLKEHWNKGDRFVIELESTIDICSSCQGYLSYLKKLGAKHGKTIEYKVISKGLVKETKDLKKIN